MVVLLEHDTIATLEECAIEFRLAGRESRRLRTRVELEQRMFTAEVVNPEVALDRQAQYGGRHCLVVVVHLPDITERSRREILRRLVTGHEHAFFGILAVTAPHGNRITEDPGEPHEQDHQSDVVLQDPGSPVQRGRLGHQSFGPRHDDREAVQGPERVAGLEVRHPVGIDVRREILATAAQRAGVALRPDSACRHVEVEAHGRASAVDREHPVEARNVPVELVVSLEEAEHPGRAVAELIGVHAVIDEPIVAAEIRAHTVAVFHHLERFVRVIAQHHERLKVHDIAVAELVVVLGGKISVDTATDAIALRADTNRLRYLDPAVFLDRDVTVELEDALVGRGQ